MMNEKVRNFFTAQKLMTSCIVLEASGTNLKMNIDKDDINFVHQVRILYKKQGHPDESLPKYNRILAAKYVLLVANQGLHPSLHRYKKVWNNDRLEIHEDMRKGGGKEFENKLVGVIDDAAMDLYKKATGRITSDKETVANWWIRENENAIHDTGSKTRRKTEGDTPLPDPMIKIIHFSGNKVSLAFRKSSRGANAKYEWYPVHGIHLDMRKFAAKAGSEGFDKDVNDADLLNYKAWEKILEPEKIGKGGGEDNPNLEPRKYTQSGGSLGTEPTTDYDKRIGDWAGKEDPWRNQKRTAVRPDHQGFINPGKKNADHNVSTRFSQLLRQEPKFEKHVKKIINQQVTSTLIRLSNGTMGAKISDDTAQVLSSFGIHHESVQSIVNDVFMGVLYRTGKVKDETWDKWLEFIDKTSPLNSKADDITTDINHWLRLMANSVSKTVIGRYMGYMRKNQSSSGITKADGGDFWSTQSDKGSDNVAHSVNTGVTRNSYQDYDDDDDEKDYYGNVLDKSKDQYPSHNPYAGGADDDDGDWRNYRSSFAKEAYSFKNYYNKRLNEMEVVWGNDKASAKKIKPGQTLKGGIQVQGAPWSVGGSINKKGNNIQVDNAIF